MALIIFVAFGIIGAWLILTPAGVKGKADAVGYAICHRIPDRSFEAFGRHLPLCARCSGIYLGVMTALTLYVAAGRLKASYLPNWKVLAGFGVFVVAIGIDGGNSYLHLFPDFEGGLYEPHNRTRLITGMFFGISFVTVLLPLFNATVWERTERRAPIGSLWELAGVCLVATLVITLVLLEVPLILLMIGLISAFGVVVMLTLIATVMVVTLMGRDGTYRRWSELWLPMLAGVTAAIALVGVIDFFRYLLTGTWDGFNFAALLIF